MDIFKNKYYIIRTGDFATDANKKIIYTFLSIALCIHDYIAKNTTEYFIIMMGSSFIWTLIELFLNERKVRIIKPMKLTYNNKTIILNKYFGICLQGIQEGGVVTIIGLYFGDRFFSYTYQTIYHIIITYMVVNMMKKESNLKILSKREINTPGSLLLMSSATVYNGIMLYYNPSHLYRSLNMFLSMIYISSIWSVVSYIKEFRKVEVQIYSIDKYVVRKDTLLDAFLILGYDVIFEIGIAYITFYNMFIIPCNKFMIA